ncbi:MAG: hypothetical protein ACI9PU_001070 [Ascidiaceihabitans sp.]|jgi:hypothetical protein|tara:strand:- start:218 stop:511 length:294 start_codon:yes stop_codon:yes gene_type:complete
MQDILSILQTLHRPQLLMRAAHIGAVEYKRSAHLPRLLGYGQMPKTTVALLKLIEFEDELNTLRKSGESAYNLVRHIDVLIAIVGEARILRASRPNG